MKSSMLIRKRSFHSLVLIPTYVTCQVTLEGVKQESEIFPVNVESQARVSLEKALSTYQPMISAEKERNIQMIEQRMVCMASLFLITCLVMVATILVVPSQYQDMVVATMINMSYHQEVNQDP